MPPARDGNGRIGNAIESVLSKSCNKCNHEVASPNLCNMTGLSKDQAGDIDPDT